MGEIVVTDQVLKALTESEASLDGKSLTVRFPLGQLIGLGVLMGAMGGSVVFAVWLSTHDLGLKLSSLSKAVTALSDAHVVTQGDVDDIDSRVHRVEVKQDVYHPGSGR